MIDKRQLDQIALILQEMKDNPPYAVEYITEQLAHVLAASNKNFDRLRFYQACEQQRLIDKFETNMRKVFGGKA
jgi:hypothetical protein